MALPRKTANSTRYARLAARGCLTRLALYFNSRPQEKFTGEEVAAMLVNAVTAIGSPDDAIAEYYVSEVPATLGDEPARWATARPAYMREIEPGSPAWPSVPVTVDPAEQVRNRQMLLDWMNPAHCGTVLTVKS